MEKFLENHWFKIKLFTAVTLIVTAAAFTWATGIEYQKIVDRIQTISTGYEHVKSENERLWAAINTNGLAIRAIELNQAEVKKDLEYIKALLLDIQQDLKLTH